MMRELVADRTLFLTGEENGWAVWEPGPWRYYINGHRIPRPLYRIFYWWMTRGS